MPHKTKPPYPAEFRKQMVELVRAGRAPADLSREFGCSDQAIRNWVAQQAADEGLPLPGKEEQLSTTEREELSKLRRQVRRLEQEREILVKATAWFAARVDKTSTTSTDL